jgi:putative ABC transport system permease protein
MYFITLVFKNLFRRKVRTFLTGLGVAVAVGTMVALVGVASGFERSALDTFQKRGEDLELLRSGGRQAALLKRLAFS